MVGRSTTGSLASAAGQPVKAGMNTSGAGESMDNPPPFQVEQRAISRLIRWDSCPHLGAVTHHVDRRVPANRAGVIGGMQGTLWLLGLL